MSLFEITPTSGYDVIGYNNVTSASVTTTTATPSAQVLPITTHVNTGANGGWTFPGGWTGPTMVNRMSSAYGAATSSAISLTATTAASKSVVSLIVTFKGA